MAPEELVFPFAHLPRTFYTSLESGKGQSSVEQLQIGLSPPPCVPVLTSGWDPDPGLFSGDLGSHSPPHAPAQLGARPSATLRSGNQQIVITKTLLKFLFILKSFILCNTEKDYWLSRLPTPGPALR